ncbi:MAG: hypothetical protein R3C26_20035 [Calditrichia bacterium]
MCRFRHLVGYGPLREQVEQQIGDLGLSEYFEIHGGLPRHKVLEMHALADALYFAERAHKKRKKEGIPVVSDGRYVQLFAGGFQ